MKHGFVKVAAGTPAVTVADCAANAERIAALMERAAADGVRLLALPELCLTGYTCADLFLQESLLGACERQLLRLAQASAGLPLITVVGAPLLWRGKLYNCAAVLYGGEILGVVPKSHLPNYGEFYERRHFTPAPDAVSAIRLGGRDCPFGANLLFRCAELPEFCFGVELCEDLWVPNPPSARQAEAGASVIVNCSASDETVGKAAYRRQLVKSQSARLVCAYLYADAGEGESTTDLVFSGHDIIAENGAILAEAAPFEQGYCVSEIDVMRLAGERRRMTTFAAGSEDGGRVVSFSMEPTDTALTRPVSKTPFLPEGEAERAERCREILSMQAHALKKRLDHTRAKSAVIGISGGLDSCLALLVSVRAMDLLGRPRADVLAVTMPCFGTTGRTRDNAVELCRRLGVSLREIDIKTSVYRHFEDIGHDLTKLDVTYENAQARERTQVLMDLANQTSGLVIGTGDLSELALGWATYNGDHMSMYGVNASIPKTLVRHMVATFALDADDEGLRAVLDDILDTPVSPELLPAADGEISQKTEHLVGPYELHDFFLYYAVRWGFSPRKVLRLAEYAFAGSYAADEILSWLRVFYRRFFAQQFKRSCLPDGPKVGSVALSPRGDWRMPSDASAALWLSELDEIGG
ncbi:NAD(+) synthase [Feifania hominis]|uniref:Glutamine-dependent NAD(+) synthetase n=1 Tax=Feifania hominis TaxID=2763660 RepID=A0A926DGC1_9FIRM|nr:NAD(+) synthase [Feifania hominis]MBC8536535.1 NAD(+) synthase [Feifania hominis]